MKKIIIIAFAVLAAFSASYAALSSPQKGTMSLNLELTDPGGTDTVTDTIILKYINASEIEPFIRARLSRYGTVQVNDALNMLIITDLQNKVTDLIKVTSKLDVKGLKNFLKTETVIIPVSNIQASDVAGFIGERLGPGAIIKVESNLNALIITDVKSKIEQARALLTLLDVPARQVMIEAKIVEIQNGRDATTGVDWRTVFQSVQVVSDGIIGAAIQPAGSQALAAGGGVAKGTMTMNGIDSIIGVLETEGKAQVLASPRIVASNNRWAYINTGDQIYYNTENINNQISGGASINVNGENHYSMGVTNTSVYGSSNSSSNASSYRNINSGYINTGINLNVTPHIVSGELVTMDIVATVNSLSGWSPAGAPIVSNRSANSTVTIKSGEVFVMGGLKKEMLVKSTDRVPFLGYIPLLGFFFSSDKETKISNDVVIFIAPTILAEAGKNRSEDSDKILDKAKEGLK